MDAALLVAFALGFLGGFKHAFEPDHLVAVSTLMHEEPTIKSALRTGVAWGAGHTTTLLGAVGVVGALRIQVSEAHLRYLEVPVGLMLLGLGGWTLFVVLRRMVRLRRHQHPAAAGGGPSIPHYHAEAGGHPHSLSVRRTGWRGYSVGLVHGLAGSGALLLLVAATLPTLGASLVYALLFGTGSILGMGLVTTALALPLRASRARPAVFDALTGLAGVLSVALGVGILFTVWG